MHLYLGSQFSLGLLFFLLMFSSYATAIINGRDAPEEKLPFFSQIYFKTNEKDNLGNDIKDDNGKVKVKWDNQCGGVLLDNNYIITAKHCVVGGDGSLEELRISYSGEPNKLFEVGKIFTPPSKYLEIINYFPNSSKYSHINYKSGDLAILYIPGISQDTPNSLAAQNNTKDKYITSMREGESGAIFGMGLTDRDGIAPRTNNIMMLDMVSVDINECSEPNGFTPRGNPYIGYKSNEAIELCARSSLKDDKYHSAYHHDSGGPLLIQNNNDYSLAGVISNTLWRDSYYPERDHNPALTLVQAGGFKHWINTITTDAWNTSVLINDMIFSDKENELLVINDVVYMYDSKIPNRKYKKIENINGSLSRAWWDDIELSDNMTFAFTPKDKWIVDSGTNALTIYDLSKKKWSSSYFHDYNELGQLIDSPMITESSLHLSTKSGEIYHAQVLNNGNIYDLKKENLPSVDGLRKIYAFSDYNGYRYYALNDSGQLLFSTHNGKWEIVSFYGVAQSFVEDANFGSRGAFLVKMNGEWYYNAGFVNTPSNEYQKPLIRLNKLDVVDSNGNRLKIQSAVLSSDNNKLYAIGDINNKQVLTVSEFSSF